MQAVSLAVWEWLGWAKNPAVCARLPVYQSPDQPPSDSIYRPALVGPHFLHKTGGVLCGMMSGNLENALANPPYLDMSLWIASLKRTFSWRNRALEQIRADWSSPDSKTPWLASRRFELTRELESDF